MGDFLEPLCYFLAPFLLFAFAGVCIVLGDRGRVDRKLVRTRFFVEPVLLPVRLGGGVFLVGFGVSLFRRSGHFFLPLLVGAILLFCVIQIVVSLAVAIARRDYHIFLTGLGLSLVLSFFSGLLVPACK